MQLGVEDRASGCFTLCERTSTERETENEPGRVASIEGSERLVTAWTRLEMRGEQPITGGGVGGGPQSEDKECRRQRAELRSADACGRWCSYKCDHHAISSV